MIKNDVKNKKWFRSIWDRKSKNSNVGKKNENSKNLNKSKEKN